MKLAGLIPDSDISVIESIIDAAVLMVKQHLDEAIKLTFDLEEADLETGVAITVDYRSYSLVIRATEGVDGVYVHLLETFDKDAPGVAGIRSIVIGHNN